MSAQRKKNPQTEPDRIEAIRGECCAALDLLRDSANLAQAEDDFAKHIYDAIVQVALILDTMPDAHDPVSQNEQRGSAPARARGAS
jgi:hypothetical protein